jgi:hypothetical protein
MKSRARAVIPDGRMGWIVGLGDAHPGRLIVERWV